MKQYYVGFAFIVCLFTTLVSFSQRTYIPDDNFEYTLIVLGFDDVMDNYVNTSSIDTITQFGLNFYIDAADNEDVEDYLLYDLTGLQDFKALKRFGLSDTYFTDLDFSENKELEYLDLFENTALERVDLSKNLKLKRLDISRSPYLRDLDLQNNKSLEYLNISNQTEDFFHLLDLDLSANIELEELYLWGILNALDLTKNVGLRKLEIGNSNISALDLSSNTSLDLLHLIRNTHLSVLNLKNGNNQSLQGSLNNGGSVVRLIELTNLSCLAVDDANAATNGELPYRDWDLRGTSEQYTDECIDLKNTVFIPDDNFEGALIDLGFDDVLDNQVLLENIIDVSEMDLENRSISDLTGISHFTKLKRLNCSRNSLISLNMSTNRELRNLDCSYNQLQSLELRGNPLLDTLNSRNNELGGISLSRNTNLKYVDFSVNNLSFILVSNSPDLTFLKVRSNNINSLDVTRNRKLEFLDFEFNRVSELNVSNNKNLTFLLLKENRLRSLDLNQNAKLTYLYCQNNQLEKLNVRNGQNQRLDTFDATGNPDLNCIEVDDADSATNGFGVYNLWRVDSGSNFSKNCQNSPRTYVPDDGFERQLIFYGYDDVLDDYVLTSNIELVETLNILGPDQALPTEVRDLIGIEDFTNLRALSITEQPIGTLDLSKNRNLEKIVLSLTDDIRSLEFSENSKLEEFVMDGDIGIETLDFSDKSDLVSLHITTTGLQVLNVQNGHNPRLRNFFVESPMLECIQVDEETLGSQNQAPFDKWNKSEQAVYSIDCSETLRDSDGDGIPDEVDSCPNTPQGETVDVNGCSESQKDDDQDGVMNDKDNCPNTPEGEAVDANGCAESQKDNDQDGVMNNKDNCPNTPQGETVDANGCSESQKDDDQDDVMNDKDTCPGTLEGEAVDANGCSESQKDDDQDGVMNDKDTCPGTPEGEAVDANGCAESQKDDDQDGAMNDKDTCPSTPQGETVDANGCSESQKDDDQDGVMNDKDTCSNTPQGETVDANGCSESQKDDDQDGVMNDKDTCPSTPEGETVDDNGCSASQALSTEDLLFKKSVKMFPNPVTSRLIIRSENITIDRIIIFSSLGREVIKTDSQFDDIDVSDLSAGVYFVKIFSERGWALKRLIKN